MKFRSRRWAMRSCEAFNQCSILIDAIEQLLAPKPGCRRRYFRPPHRRTRWPKSFMQSTGRPTARSISRRARSERNAATRRIQGRDQESVPAGRRRQPEIALRRKCRSALGVLRERIFREITLERNPHRRPRFQRAAQPVVRSRRAAPHARHGTLPAWRNAGAGCCYAGYRRRRTEG